MQKHVHGMEPSFGNWFMSSPGKRNCVAAIQKRKARVPSSLGGSDDDDDDDDDGSDDDDDNFGEW